MRDSIQAFGDLLEKYVCSVADKFIELVDHEDQTKLIHMVNKIDSSPPVADAPISTDNSPTEHLREINTEHPADSYITGLEKQWQAALRQPASLRNITFDKRITLIGHLITTHQTNIDFTMNCILRIDMLLVRVRENIEDTHKNAFLTTHYQSIKNRYVAYIAKLEALQEKELVKLEQGL